MIKQKPQNKGIEIDLTGPQGNAFYLLGTAKNLAKQLEMDKSEIETLMTQMRSGDYKNLVQVFDKHFGSFVTLFR